MKLKVVLSAVAALACMQGSIALAGTITSWNMDNVTVPTGPYVNDTTYFSTIYDRDVTGGTAGAVTNGAIVFTPPEGAAPGLKVVNNEPYPGSGQAIPNCIMAAGAATCQGPFQSGKRFKEKATSTGPISLVFNVADSQQDTSYRVYEKLGNITNGRLGGFNIELGFGVGNNFIASTANDGLGFDLGAGGDTQFAFGLFGDAATSPNHTLDGFFDTTATSGFNVNLTEDMFSTTNIYGSYKSQFGDWLAGSMVPQGYFWDNDGNPATDAILMAWRDSNGNWIQQRIENGNIAEPSAPTIVSEADLIAAGYTQGPIDDLANLNVNYNLLIGDISNWSTYNNGAATFTIRLTPKEVPEPATLAIFGMGLAAFGWRRRKAA